MFNDVGQQKISPSFSGKKGGERGGGGGGELSPQPPKHKLSTEFAGKIFFPVDFLTIDSWTGF